MIFAHFLMLKVYFSTRFEEQVVLFDVLNFEASSYQ